MESPRYGSPMSSDWMHIRVVVPPRDGAALLRLLRDEFGFEDIDWCLMQRPDQSMVDYGPVAAPEQPAP
jgi:hypothetical protein